MITVLVVDLLAEPHKYVGKHIRCTGRVVYARGVPPRMVDPLMDEAARYDGRGDSVLLREPRAIMDAVERNALGLKVGGNVVMDMPAILRGIVLLDEGRVWLSDVESGTVFCRPDQSLFDFVVERSGQREPGAPK